MESYLLTQSLNSWLFFGTVNMRDIRLSMLQVNIKIIKLYTGLLKLINPVFRSTYL